MRNKKVLSLIIAFSIILGIAAPIANVAVADNIEDPEVKAVRDAISRFRKAHSIHEIDTDYINKVEDATAKYNELTAAQKEDLKAIEKGYHITKLDEANAKIVNLYISRFKKSTKVEDIDDDYIAKVTKAANAYDALTPGGKEALKKMNNGYHVKKLEEARAKVAKVEDPEVENVRKLISAFSKSTKVEDIDQDYIDKVMAAKEAYDALTPEQQELLATKNNGYHVDKLEDALQKIEQVKVDVTVEELGGKVTTLPIPGVFSVRIGFEEAKSEFSGLTKESTLVLKVEDAEDVELVYDEERNVFKKDDISGSVNYTEESLNNAVVVAEGLEEPVPEQPEVTVEELGGKVTSLPIPGVFSVRIGFEEAEAKFSNLTKESTLVLKVENAEDVELVYDADRNTFKKDDIRGSKNYSIESLKSANVVVK